MAISENLFLTTKTWKAIRNQFSEDEKTKLNAAIAGQVICPPGVIVDGEKLDRDLALKLGRAVREADSPAS